MTPIVKVQLTYEEQRGLEEMAVRNLRRPADELRWLLREALQRHQPNAPKMKEGCAYGLENSGASFPSVS